MKFYQAKEYQHNRTLEQFDIKKEYSPLAQILDRQNKHILDKQTTKQQKKKQLKGKIVLTSQEIYQEIKNVFKSRQLDKESLKEIKINLLS